MPESVLEVLATFVGACCLWILEAILILKCFGILNLIPNNFVPHVDRIEAIEKLDEIEIGEDTICAICLDNVIQGIALPECKHVFHKECIGKWMQQSISCPYCRTAI